MKIRPIFMMGNYYRASHFYFICYLFCSIYFHLLFSSDTLLCHYYIKTFLMLQVELAPTQFMHCHVHITSAEEEGEEREVWRGGGGGGGGE